MEPKKYVVLGIVFLTLLSMGSNHGFSSVTNREKGIVFEDDFDTGNTPGQDPVGWEVTEFGAASDVSISAETSHSSPYSVKLYNPANSGINLWHGFYPVSKGVVSCALQTNANGVGVTTDNDADQWGIVVFFWNGKIMYLDPTGWKDLDPPMSYTLNTWYIFSFEFDCSTNTYDISVNGEVKKTGALMRSPSYYFDQIWFISEYNYVSIGFVDDVSVSSLNSPPSIPSNPSPADNSSDVPLQQTLSWTCFDPDGDPVTYDVYFGTSSPPPKVVSNQSSKTYKPEALAYFTTYYWQIIAWDDEGASTAGPIWCFTTLKASLPDITIESITGGFGVHAVIKNSGNAAATNVAWSMTLTGGAFLGKSTESSIASIAAGADSSIKSKLIFGIGRTTILVTASCDEGATTQRNTTGFVLGPFVLGVK